MASDIIFIVAAVVILFLWKKLDMLKSTGRMLAYMGWQILILFLLALLFAKY